jgi:hypothetical protein
MDEFKKYLRDNRHLLDVEKPPRAGVWQHIQQHSSTRRRMMVKPMVRWVAAACIVLLTGAATYLLWPSNTDPGFVNAQPDTRHPTPDTVKMTGRTDSSGPAISPLPGEVIAAKSETSSKKSTNTVLDKSRRNKRPALLKKRSPVDALQENYASIINVQLKKLESTPIHVESPDYFHAFKKQWYDMEKDEKKIKEDIRLYGLTDAVLTQFIQLYQQKLQLLKQLQDEINKMNNRAQQYPEIQSKSPSYLKM